MATYTELLAQKRELQAELDKLREAEREEVIVAICRQMVDYEITVRDLIEASGRRRPKARARAPAKYRDPGSGSTWSGRGKPPRWIKDATDRDQFLIRSQACL